MYAANARTSLFFTPNVRQQAKELVDQALLAFVAMSHQKQVLDT